MKKNQSQVQGKETTLGERPIRIYIYEALNRLIHATGKAKNASYDMAMTFGRMSEPLTKVQKVDSTTTAKSYINISSIISISSKKVSSFLESVPQQIHKAYRAIKKGGPTFAQYKRQYWREHSKRNLPDLYSRENGTVWRQYEELHHRFIPQISKWVPNWLKNNRINLKRVSSLGHAQTDPYRARIAPKWAKEEYNLKTK
ncbi:hypothetical protein [Prevotella histicola]|jgi:RHS repeat-associated core domain protein|uniref:hypothetical protein n=1 Tax=Prevotella histicola TaxID=470565 RepID=UPI003C787582